MIRSLIIFVTIFIGLSFAEGQEKTAQLISYDQLVKLSQAQRTQYLKEVRDLVGAIQAGQYKDGTQYGTQLNFLFEQAIAADDLSPQLCNCGGFFKEKKGLLCPCNWCDPSTKKQVQCNPVLFGDKCVPRSLGNDISKKCAEDSSQDLDSIAKSIQSGKVNRDEWSKLQQGFAGYCDKKPRDRSSECMAITSRLNALNQKVGVTPVVASAEQMKASQPAKLKMSPASGAAEDPALTQDICRMDGSRTAQSMNSCVRCPSLGEAVTVHTYYEKTKYGQLAKTIVNVCGVANGNPDADGFKAMKVTPEDVINKFGNCSAKQYDGANNFKTFHQKLSFGSGTNYQFQNDEKAEHDIKSLVRGSKEAKEVAGDRYNSMGYTDSMQKYFGMTMKEFRKTFCAKSGNFENVNVNDVVNKMQARPVFSFIPGQDEILPGEGGFRLTANELEQLDKEHFPLTEVPSYASNIVLDPSEGTKLEALNRYLEQNKLRKSLASCLENNKNKNKKEEKSIPQCDLLISDNKSEKTDPNGCINKDGKFHQLVCHSRSGPNTNANKPVYEDDSPGVK